MRMNSVCRWVHACLCASKCPLLLPLVWSLFLHRLVHPTLGQELQGPMAVGSLHSRFFLNVLYYKLVYFRQHFFFLFGKELDRVELSLGSQHFVLGYEA